MYFNSLKSISEIEFSQIPSTSIIQATICYLSLEHTLRVSRSLSFILQLTGHVSLAFCECTYPNPDSRLQTLFARISMSFGFLCVPLKTKYVNVGNGGSPHTAALRNKFPFCYPLFHLGKADRGLYVNGIKERNIVEHPQSALMLFVQSARL